MSELPQKRKLTGDIIQDQQNHQDDTDTSNVNSLLLQDYNQQENNQNNNINYVNSVLSKNSKVFKSFGDNTMKQKKSPNLISKNIIPQNDQFVMQTLENDKRHFTHQNQYQRNNNHQDGDEDLTSQDKKQLFGGVARSLDSKGNPKLILYKRRWIVLTSFSLALVALGQGMATCVTIAPLLMTFYKLTTFEANLANLLYLIMYVPFNFVQIIIQKQYGLRVSVIIGAIVTVVGSWLRLFIGITDFYMLLVGASIAAMGQPFLMNNPSKVASNWFGDKERGIATAIGSMSVPIGMLFSFVLPNAFISNDDVADIPNGIRKFEIYLLVQTIIITIFSLPAIILMKEEPPSPPSVVSYDNANKMGMGEGLKELIGNKNYLLLFFSFNFIYGIHGSLGATIASIASQYGYGVNASSTMCFVYLFGGIFNSFFLGTMLDKYQNFRKLVIIICAMSLITCCIHIVALPTGNVLFESVAMMLVGASVLPITSISYSFAVELTYPIPETMTNGMMISISLIWGSAVGFLCQVLADIDGRVTLAFWALCSLVALILSFFIKQDLRRLDIDDVKNSEYIEDDEFRRQSYEQREAFLRESGFFNENDKFKFEFDLQDKEKTTFLKVNRSYDHS